MSIEETVIKYSDMLYKISVGMSDDSGRQYDLLLYDDRAVYGYNFSTQKNNPGSTGEELLTAAVRYPGAQTLDGVTKEEMMQYLMMFNEDTFINWETGVCQFDSEGFKAVLEYVNRFPDSLESGGGGGFPAHQNPRWRSTACHSGDE